MRKKKNYEFFIEKLTSWEKEFKKKKNWKDFAIKNVKKGQKVEPSIARGLEESQKIPSSSLARGKQQNKEGNLILTKNDTNISLK